MKRCVAICLLFCCLFMFCSCENYVSSYKAVGLVKSKTSHSVRVQFHSLEGSLVFTLQKSGKGTEGNIQYAIECEEGELHLYYVTTSGVKEELATANAGESLESVGGYVEGGKRVKVIIEAQEKTKGKVSVELDH